VWRALWLLFITLLAFGRLTLRWAGLAASALTGAAAADQAPVVKGARWDTRPVSRSAKRLTADASMGRTWV
jgi:hypothetical protein